MNKRRSGLRYAQRVRSFLKNQVFFINVKYRNKSGTNRTYINPHPRVKTE